MLQWVPLVVGGIPRVTVVWEVGYVSTRLPFCFLTFLLIW